MSMASSQLPVRLTTHTFIILFLLASVPDFILGQVCGTDQNPYCASNPELAALCCPYPAVCYWSDRDGTPGCCPAGEDCRLNGGPGPTQIGVAQQSTYYVVQTLSTQQYVTYTYYSTPAAFTAVGPVTTNNVIVVTNTQDIYHSFASGVGGAYTTVVSAVVGAYTTMTRAVVGAGQSASQVLLGSSNKAWEVPYGLLFSMCMTVLGFVTGILLL